MISTRLIPYSRKTYFLKISELDFYSKINQLIQPSSKNYFGHFNDPNKSFRGFINKEKREFFVERNLGSFRGFKPRFTGKYSLQNNLVVLEIEIKPFYSDYFLIGFITLLMILMTYQAGIISVLGTILGLYIFWLAYFNFEVTILLNAIEEIFKPFSNRLDF